jgi:hypothetical protein
MKSILYIGEALEKDVSVHGRSYHFVKGKAVEYEDGIANLLLRDKIFKEVEIIMPKFVPKEVSIGISEQPVKPAKYKKKGKNDKASNLL